MRRRGIFITFEGPEGSGKSTQSKLLAAYLKKKGLKALCIREPGGTAAGEKIRRILLDRKNDGISPSCEMLLYMAARAQLVKEVIAPALEKGMVVICDRFLDSTLAYQGFGLGIDPVFIRRVGAFATAGIRPDMTILLDLSVSRGLRHRRQAEDRIEARALSYHVRVRKGYLKLAQEEPDRIRIVKVSREKMTTQRKIRGSIDRLLEKRYPGHGV